MLLLYKDIILISFEDISDIDNFLNRPMFNNTNIQDLHIVEDRSISDYNVTIINGLDISNMEYTILDILYSNDPDINNRYTFYQYLYTHPLLSIDNIDEYIKYRDKLEDICYLDKEYRKIIRIPRN